MTSYRDDVVTLDEDGITIHNYRRVGDHRHIPYGSVNGFEAFGTGFWSGRYRLIGISLGRPRSWFGWDSRRRKRQTAIAVDVGGWIRPTITPDDPEAVIGILREKTA